MFPQRLFSFRPILIGLPVLISACSQFGPASPVGSAISQSDQTPNVIPTLPVEYTVSPPAPLPTQTAPTEKMQTATMEPASPTAQVPSPTPTTAIKSTPTIPPTRAITPSPTPSPTRLTPVFPPNIGLEPVTNGFQAPVYLTAKGDAQLFIVEKVGRIYLVENGVVQAPPFLDISDRVGSDGSEQGLLSVAFSPDYTTSGHFYVNYTDQRGDTVVARYRLLSEVPSRADPSSEQKILEIAQPAANHNGGQIQFGPDGFLYVGMGDGGRAGDPWGNAQNPGVLLGKILRINVVAVDAYTVPSSNPLLDQPGARPEIWATGLRNPWRFTFDRATGVLYIADVGQNTYEEVNVQPSASPGGENYGWDVMEANHCFEPQTDCDTHGLVLPVAEYDHSQGCSITGGYVYRGTRYPQMTGVYFFGDFCSGNIWGLRQKTSGEWQMALLLNTSINISSFGEDSAGEIYVVGYNDGTVYHLTGLP